MSFLPLLTSLCEIIQLRRWWTSCREFLCFWLMSTISCVATASSFFARLCGELSLFSHHPNEDDFYCISYKFYHRRQSSETVDRHSWTVKNGSRETIQIIIIIKYLKGKRRNFISILFPPPLKCRKQEKLIMKFKFKHYFSRIAQFSIQVSTTSFSFEGFSEFSTWRIRTVEKVEQSPSCRYQFN